MMDDNVGDSPSPRGTIAAFLIIALAIAGGMALLLVTQPPTARITINPPIPTVTPIPTATPGPVTVYITGAVVRSETMLELAPGSRVENAITAAGGVTLNADLERVNLAALVRDGDQIHIPEIGVEPILPTPSGGRIVYINTATLEELIALPEIGPSTAQAILDYRAANGPFANFEALDAVDGIGPATLAQLQGRITFD